MADYTEQQLIGALRKADAAGDVQAAKAIARRIHSMRQAAPDFSNVETSSSTRQGMDRSQTVRAVEGGTANYAGPALQPSNSGYTPISDEEARRRSAETVAAAGPLMSPMEAKTKAFQRLPFPVRAAIGAGGRVAQVGRGLRQLYAAGADIVAPRQSKLANLVTGAPDSRYEEEMLREEAARAKDAYMEGDKAATLGRFGADVVMLAAPASKIASLPRAGQYAGSVALGGTVGAVDPVTRNDSRLANMALGGAAGAGGQVAGELVGAGASTLSRYLRPGGGVPREAAQAVAEAVPAEQRTGQKLQEMLGEVEAGTNPAALMGREKYGLVYTQGQRMIDPDTQFAQLSREEVLRQAPGAGSLFRAAEQNNVSKLDEALGGLGERFGGSAGATPAEMAQGAASRLRGQADELGGQITAAYGRAGEGARTAVSRDAISALPDRLQKSVAEWSPNMELTPATAKTLQQVRNATMMILGPKGERSNVAGVTLKALETQRRIINRNIDAAANRADRAAMTTLKREFDGWLDDSIEGALISGDPKALDALKEARGLRAEFGRRFEGRTDADRFITGLLDGTKTPEELINVALGASQVSKAGGARFIERLRDASGGDPGVIGNLRAAHFLRMTRGANGEPLQMGQIVRNIKTTDYNNASVVKALYAPEEWAEVRQLAQALEPLVAKVDFARTSGTAERLARMLFSKTTGGLPLVGPITQGIEDAFKNREAQRVLTEPLRLPNRPSPLTNAAIQGASQEAWRQSRGM